MKKRKRTSRINSTGNHQRLQRAKDQIKALLGTYVNVALIPNADQGDGSMEQKGED